MPASQLFLIDAHALCYRAFYAIKDLTTSKGQVTNAVYGFTNTLRKVLREHRPEYLAVCFDSPTKTKRRERFADYKIHRPVMPDDLISQIPIIKDVARAYQLAVLELPGYEADDIMATLARKFCDSQLRVVIASDDKDMFQLVGENVTVWSPRKDKFIGPADVKEMMGVTPERVVDFLGLAGDSSDNIPGVKGIGEVTAQKLVQEFGALENIVAHLADVTPKRAAESLAQEQDMAFLSRELATVDDQVPVGASLDEFRIKPPDQSRLFALFTELEFGRFAVEFAPALPSGKIAELRRHEVATEAAATELESAIKQRGIYAFHGGLGEATENIFWSEEIFIAVGPADVYRLSGNVAKALTVWQDEAVVKVTYDVKAQFKVLSSWGVGLKGKIFDIKLAAYLVSPLRSDYEIKDLARQYLQITVGEEQRLVRETAALAALFEPLQTKLHESDLDKLFSDIEIPLALVLARMELEGVKIDEAHLAALSHKCTEKINALVKELYRLAGEEFNLNSPKQLSVILFQKLQLPVIKRTKTGFSTDEEVLSRLAATHPLPALLLEYRQLAKLKSTYIDALPKLIDSRTGKIHASFNQTGTETGRLSSNNPNLQNIPIRTELGRQIRRAFVADGPDQVMISADYSQIELRILAHLSGDENFLAAFRAGEDIHAATAAQIFAVEEKDVTAEMRVAAKRVNFGISYGMSPFGLAKDLSISQEQAAEFIARYFLRYPAVRTFMDTQIKQCEERGFVTTLLNRRRYIPDITSSNNAIRQFAQRQAINTPVQGSAADLIKLAMVRIQDDLDRLAFPAKMIITVHDELVFTVARQEQDRLVALIKEQMENALTLTVPITVSIKCGANWLEMEKI